MMAGVKPDSAQKASCKAAGNWFFNTSPTNNFPSTAPLPSSPKTKPNGDMLLTIPFPSYRQELEPVPKIQAMPGCLHKGHGGCQQIAADLHRDRQIARDRTAYNLVLFRECTSGTIKVNGPDRIGLPYPGNQIVPYLSRDLLFRLEKRINSSCPDPVYLPIAGHNTPIRFRGTAIRYQYRFSPPYKANIFSYFLGFFFPNSVRSSGRP